MWRRVCVDHQRGRRSPPPAAAKECSLLGCGALAARPPVSAGGPMHARPGTQAHAHGLLSVYACVCVINPQHHLHCVHVLHWLLWLGGISARLLPSTHTPLSVRRHSSKRTLSCNNCAGHRAGTAFLEAEKLCARFSSSSSSFFCCYRRGTTDFQGIVFSSSQLGLGPLCHVLSISEVD